MRKFVSLISLVLLCCVLALAFQSSAMAQFSEKDMGNSWPIFQQFNDKKIDEAGLHTALKDFLESNPGEPDSVKFYIYLYLMIPAIDEKNTEEALAIAREAYEKMPSSGYGHLIMGLVLEETNKKDEARGYYITGLNIIGKDSLSPFLLKTTAEAISLSPAALWQAFDDNEVAAEDAYKGKIIAVTGKISAITTNMSGEPQVAFSVDQYGLNQVLCMFDKQDRSVIAGLKKGQQVLIAGTCNGFLIKNVILRKCWVVE